MSGVPKSRKTKKPSVVREATAVYLVRPEEVVGSTKAAKIPEKSPWDDFFEESERISPDSMEDFRPEQIGEKKVAKVFMSGRSQAVRLPKEFRMQGEEVYVQKVGDKLILTPKVQSLQDLFDSLPRLSEDFPDEVPDLPLQERELF